MKSASIEQNQCEMVAENRFSLDEFRRYLRMQNSEPYNSTILHTLFYQLLSMNKNYFRYGYGFHSQFKSIIG